MHQQVTRRFLDSAVRAQLQVQGRCGGYHRVLYMVTSEHLLSNSNSSRAQKVEADLAALQEALGEDGVIAIGPQGAGMSVCMTGSCCCFRNAQPFHGEVSEV